MVNMNSTQEPVIPDLNLVAALSVLLRERSVTRAASRLGISQSAVSHKLRALRELLGDEILVGARGAQVLTDRATQIERSLHAALEAVTLSLARPEAFSPTTSTRMFRVATGDVGEFTVMTEALEKLEREAPGVRVEFVRPGKNLERDLEDGSVDFAVGIDAQPLPGLMRMTILREPFVVLLRKKHPRRRNLTLPAYLSLEHVGVSGKSPVDTELAARRVRVRVGSPIVAAHLACQSDLAFTTGLMFATAFARRTPCEIVRHPQIRATTPLQLVWHRRSSQDPGAEWARDLAVGMTRDLAHEARSSLSKLR